jgi:hypothetical protein
VPKVAQVKTPIEANNCNPIREEFITDGNDQVFVRSGEHSAQWVIEPIGAVALALLFSSQ